MTLIISMVALKHLYHFFDTLAKDKWSPGLNFFFFFILIGINDFFVTNRSCIGAVLALLQVRPEKVTQLILSCLDN